MPRIDEWSDRLRRSLSGNYSRDDIEGFVRDLVTDCEGFIERDENLRIPSFGLSLCDDDQFQQLLRLLPRIYAYEPIAITVGRGSDRLIAINIGKLLLLMQNENPHQTFVLNLALAAIEELVHAARPDLSETQVNDIVNGLGERYLGVTIPREVRERLARIVAENEAASNERRNQS
jgi:hypothetical protein